MRAERANSLPGIRFVAEPDVLAGTLPRMDVAAFVGFAARGPLHVPVAVEDAAQFRDLFGDDLPLAWDREGRYLQHSLLGPSVELFFRNGGRRCWVVRVGLTESAQTQSFRVSGLYRADALLTPARVRARAPGAWADRLKVGACLSSRPLTAPELEIGERPEPYRLLLSAGSVSPELGDLIELRVPEAGLRLYLFVEGLTRERGALHLHAADGYWFGDLGADDSFTSSPPLEDFPGGLQPLEEAVGLSIWADSVSPAPLLQARLLRLELLAWAGDRLDARLGELGFDHHHARYWGDLPDDQSLYRRILELEDGALGLDLSELWRDARTPRFPLAGAAAGGRYLPLGVSVRCSPEAAVAGDLALSGSGLGVEGLIALSADPFLDPDLAGQLSVTLLSEAKHKRFVRGDSLLGVHSLLPIGEVSLIGVPDAGHRHWDRRPRPSDPPLPPLPAPWLEEPVGERDERGRRSLTWRPVVGARGYLVEQASSPEFETARRYRVESPDALELQEPGLLPIPEAGILVTLDEECPTEIYFRVRAFGYADMSAWSNTQVLRLPEGGFRGCARADVNSLGLRLGLEPGAVPGSRRLVWSAVSRAGLDGSITGFELQCGREADFLTPNQEYSGGDLSHELPLQYDVRAYCRVRALTPGGPGPWSNTIVVEPSMLAADSLQPADEYDAQDLLAVHYALVRLCAARADCLGLLSLPAHFRAPDVSDHLEALRPAEGRPPVFGSGELRVPSLVLDESQDLSHAALFHPWARHGYDGSADVRRVGIAPPDGPVLGAIAARSLARGAWISPANEPLLEVLGLTPSLDEDAAADLLQGSVNLLRGGPRGFLMVKADTLSPEQELRPLSVRRFMHLLRRLIEREGIRYVFEANSEDFRDAVRAQWRQLLLDLYVRGALRGERPERAFRVIVDPSGEAARSPGSGRLVVELNVAPAQPLRFLTVRLVQAGPDGLEMQEV